MSRAPRDTQKITRCPFYRKDSPQTILCEGIIPDTKISQNFDCQAHKEVQKDIFCDGNFECCEMFRAIMRFKYLEEEID